MLKKLKAMSNSNFNQNFLSDLEHQINGISKLKEIDISGLEGITEYLFSQQDGRIVIFGLGKSGLIGKKISATLASTGCDSIFIHATEALHGDLGIVKSKDLCLLISNSGTTLEVVSLIEPLKKRGCKIACMCSVKSSRLWTNSDYQIELPIFEELGIVKLAPMISTTQCLVLGDILANAMMRKYNFGIEDFAVNHPSGKLGARFRTVNSIMKDRREIVFTSKTAKIADVVKAMISNGYGIAAIENDDGTLFGVVTDGDIRRHIMNGLDRPIFEICSTQPIAIDRNLNIVTAQKILNENKVYTALVTNESKVVGLLRMHDIICELA